MSEQTPTSRKKRLVHAIAIPHDISDKREFYELLEIMKNHDDIEGLHARARKALRAVMDESWAELRAKGLLPAEPLSA